MKIKKSSSPYLLYQSDLCSESELEDLPNKIVKVDEDIEVSVRELSHRRCKEDPAWMSSLKLNQRSDPLWLNESSLVLAGSPYKRKENGLFKSKDVSIQSPIKNRKLSTPVKNGGQSSTGLNCDTIIPNSPKCIPKVILSKNPTVENNCSYTCNGNDNISCAKSNLNGDPECFKTSSPSRKVANSPDLFDSALVSSNLSNTPPAMLQKRDNSDISYLDKPINNLPENTYVNINEMECKTDNGTKKADLISTKDLNPKESDNEYLLSQANGEKDKINSKVSREMKQLYVSLKEIPWAQNWNPHTILGSKKPPRRTLKHNTPASKTPVKKASNLSKKKALNILTSKSQKKIMKIKIAKKIKLDKNEPCYKVPKFKLKKVKKADDGIHYKIPQYSLKKVKQECEILKNAKSKAPLKPSLRKNVDTKKSFAIRFDFINAKSNEKHNLKRKNHEDNQVANKNTPIQMTNANKGMFPELKIKLEPLETTTKQCKEVFDYTKYFENCNKSKMQLDNVNSYNIDTILQDKISRELRGKGSYSNLAKKREINDESVRLSIRQTKAALFRYKEISVKKHPGFIQIILIPNNNKQKGLVVEALIELKDALIDASKDPSCKLVLLNSSGAVFCCGIDLSSLLSADKLKASEKIAIAIKELVNEMALFAKPLVAAVNGDCFGFGLAILPFCDVVFASDKATFYTPYAKIGYIPEAALTLMLPQAVGSIIASDMLLRGRKLTAQEAKIHGLVSEVIWPTMLMEEVIPCVKKMVSQPLKAMELTKMMLRSNQLERLKLTLENETRLLPKQWLSAICQKNIRNCISSGYFDN